MISPSDAQVRNHKSFPELCEWSKNWERGKNNTNRKTSGQNDSSQIYSY